MKIIHNGFIYEEVVNDGKYDIEKIKRSAEYNYQIVDGVNYRITRNTDIHQIEISKINNTEDNEFYPEQIQRYVEYIRNGGLIEPFPVEVSKHAYTLDSMLDFLDTNSEYEDEMYSEFKDPGVPGLKVYSLSSIIIDNDEGEPYYPYRRLNPKANTVQSCFPNGVDENEKAILPFLVKVFDFFEEHAEYTLINQNHRMAALKELGKRVVLIRKH
jgi:hypothetical protein